jgi:hypothetical protein
LSMLDVIYVAAAVAAFCLLWLYLIACGKL